LGAYAGDQLQMCGVKHIIDYDETSFIAHMRRYSALGFLNMHTTSNILAKSGQYCGSRVQQVRIATKCHPGNSVIEPVNDVVVMTDRPCESRFSDSSQAHNYNGTGLLGDSYRRGCSHRTYT